MNVGDLLCVDGDCRPYCLDEGGISTVDWILRQGTLVLIHSINENCYMFHQKLWNVVVENGVLCTVSESWLEKI